jgi:SagB-type dehydrogenase family enzyme
VYHAESRIHHDSVFSITAREVEALTASLDYKRYPDALHIDLPRDLLPLGASLDEAIRMRRSVRTFSPEPLSPVELATLLGLSAGVIEPGLDGGHPQTPGRRHTDPPGHPQPPGRRYTDPPGHPQTPGGVPRRAAPSAGALYGVEAYALVLAVEGIVPGACHYDPLGHRLERVGPLRGAEDLWSTLWEGFRGATPALAVALTGRLPRVETKYQERAYRFVLMESGHIVQNVLLVAAALGLGAVPIGGFVDDELSRILRIDGEEEVPLYLALVGKVPP